MDAKACRAVDANTIEVAREVPATIVTVRHERGFLEQHLKAITAQRDAFVEARDSEIAEVEELLAQMDELGIVAKPVEAEPMLADPGVMVERQG